MGTRLHPNPNDLSQGPVRRNLMHILSPQEVNDRADAMAARLKAGLRDALNRTEIPGQVHGLASVVHIALGIESDDEGISTVPHDRLAKATAGDRSSMIKLAMLNEGVDMMGGIGFMVSAVHCEDDIDLTAEAFERALIALREERVI